LRRSTLPRPKPITPGQPKWVSVVPNLKYLVWYYSPYILFLSEILVHRNKIKEFRYILGFDSCFCVDRVSRGCGLDLYWGSFIKRQIVDYSNNHITFDILDDGKCIWRLASYYDYPNGVGDMLLGTSFGSCPNRPLTLGAFLVISTTSWMQVREVVEQNRSNQLINGFCLTVMNYGLSDVPVED